MNKYRLQNCSNTIYLFFSSLFIAFNLVFTQKYTYPFDDIISIDQYSLTSTNKIVTHNYKLINCPDIDRKMFISTIDNESSGGYFSIAINQIKLQNAMQYSNDYDNKVTFQVAEICMKQVYVKAESIQINARSQQQTFILKSKPDFYNKNMIAIPFIIGYKCKSMKQKVYIENNESQDDGFQFTFNISISDNIKSIDINYLYYEEKKLNKYYYFDQILSNKYKTLSTPIQNFDGDDSVSIKTQCKDNIPQNCKIMMGLSGFDLIESNERPIIKMNYDLNKDTKEVKIGYQVQKLEKTNGITSQLVIFQMMRCKNNQNSQEKINHKHNCIEKCPDGEYQDDEKERNIFICKKCSSTCKTCQNASNQCLSCADNQFLYSNQCYKEYPKNTYCDKNNNINYFKCNTCQNTCTDYCNKVQQCIPCQPQQYQLNNQCYSMQPKSTYCEKQNDIYQCVQCPEDCTFCNKTDCSSCKEKFYLLNKKCLQTEPNDCDCKPQNDYFSCTLCPQNCTKCNSQECTSCTTGYYLLDKKCSLTEPFSTNCKQEKNYYNCNKCQSNCPRHCDDNQKCVNCLDNKYYYKGKCYDKQPEKTFKKDDEYFDCHQTCQTCKDSTENSCLSCDNIEFIQEQNSCKCKNSNKGLNKTTYICENCSMIGCSQCTNNNQQCEQCENFFDLINNKCQCKETFKLIGTNCKCIDEIMMQYNSHTEKCECKIGLKFDVSFQKCICSDNLMYFNDQTKSCIKIPYSKYCEQSDAFKPECKKCEQGFKLLNGSCHFCDENSCDCDQIGQNFIYDSKTKDCKCKDKYPHEVFDILTKKRYCAKTISNGLFCDQNNECKECQQNCLACKDQKQCSFCNEGFFLWQGKCFKNCPNNQNLIENRTENICECPEGYKYKILKGQKEGKCLQPLKQESIYVENAFMCQRDDYMQNEKVTITTYNNLVKLIFNRDLLDEEKLNFDIFINIDSLQKDKDYFIKNTFFVDNMIISEIEVVKNQKCHSLTYSLNGQNQTINLKNTLLTTSEYNKNQIGQKDLSSNLQTMTKVLSPADEKSKGMLDFLKQFQILCLISNFVQVLGPITLFKDNIPPLIYVVAEMGASFIFSEVPSTHKVGQSQESYKSTTVTEILPSPYSIMQGLGLKKQLYSNFIMVHIILDISALLIMIFLIARKVHSGKQYSLKIVDQIANIIVKYLQTSITCTLFSIAYSLYFPESQGLAIFQILIMMLLFIEFIYLMSYRSEAYIQKYISNFYEDINYKAYASKSYIIVQFFKKFFVISAIICLSLQPITCTILIATVFFCNGIYILKFRFFEYKVINILKIIQEFLIGTLFSILATTIKKYSETLEQSEVLDEDLLIIEKYSFVTIIFFSICLIMSLLLFIIRLIILIYKIFKYIQMKCCKRSNQKIVESFLEISNQYSNNSQLYIQKISTNIYNITDNCHKQI